MYYKVLPDEALVAHPSEARKSTFAANHLEIRLFHGGHGECILIVFPNKNCWLVDCGQGYRKKSNKKLADNVITYIKGKSLQLTTIVPTHPHSDHARAFTTILTDPSPNIAKPLKIYRSNDAGWSNLNKKWLAPYRIAVATGGVVEVLDDRIIPVDIIPPNLTAQIFAGNSGKKTYISVFIQLKFHGARVLFTGDAYKSYEKKLRNRFGTQFFRADVLKITHHGSEGGTDEGVLRDILPGIAVASTGHDGGHRLEDITRKHIKAGGPKVRVFETFRDQKKNQNERDIIITTDGLPINGGGILYRVRHVAPEFS